MTEIIKYHNDFNRVKLPALTELEQDLLFTILAKVKDKGSGNMIELFPNDLKINERLNSRQYLTDVMDSLKTKFFKANFREIIETETEIIDKTINLFQEMQIHYVKRNPDDGYDTNKLFNRVVLIVNPRFAYLVNEITQNFTVFELSEFVSLNGKYTKTLYRLLKQFRTTGKVYFKWEDFLELMDIPKYKQIGEIERDILKPAIKELTRERHLFDQIRTPFKNLTYEKKKQKGTRGRGGKVIGITFTFKPESITMQKLEKKTLMDKENEKNKHLQMLMQMRQFKYKFRYENYLHFITGYDYQKYKISTWKYTNTLADDEAITQEYTVKDEETFFKMIQTFFNNIELD